jgi:ribosomal protein L13E
MNDKSTYKLKKSIQENFDTLDVSHIEDLYTKVQLHIDQARRNIQKAIDTEMVNTFWNIGKEIIEEEQKGSERSAYGKAVLQTLSNKLTQKYGRGFSVDNLERARKFYLLYPYGSLSENSATPSRNSKADLKFHSNLSWSHYVQLIRIKRPETRSFYTIEASKNNWSARELQRQVGSL